MTGIVADAFRTLKKLRSETITQIAGRWRWQIVIFIVLLIFVAFIVRPLRPAPQFGSNEISRQWNESIAKLGIDPIFPPQENVYVGDVYAIITGLDPSADQTFLGTSVLIDHVNVRWAYPSKDRDVPTFATTGSEGQKQSAPAGEVDVPEAYKDHAIDLKLVAFPGVTITHKVKASANAGAGLVSGAARRENAQIEQIDIPVAETYGIAPPDAVSALDLWCSAPETKIRCTRNFALKMLSYTVGDAFSKRTPSGQAPSVALLMVSRVYLAREFDVQRSDEGGGTVGSQTQRSTSQPAGTPADTTQSGQIGASAMLAEAYANKEGVKQIFRRPVVFGYKSVKRGL